MGSFEYVMALISIVIGLAITHILAGLGGAAHRLRGLGPPIKLDVIYLLWIGTTFIWLVSFWWWEFKYQEMAFAWNYAAYLFMILYATALFMMSVLLVPERLDGVTNTYDHFIASRHWFFGALFAASALDVVDTLLKGTDWLSRPAYIAQMILFGGASIVGAFSTRRSVQLIVALLIFAFQLYYTWTEMNILGNW